MEVKGDVHINNYTEIHRVEGDVKVYGGGVKVYDDGAVQEAAQPCGRPRAGEAQALFAVPEEAEQMLATMQRLVGDGKGKRAALVVTCFLEEGWLRDKPTYEQMQALCGHIGTRSGYYQQLGAVFPADEKELIKRQMRG